MRTIYGLTLLLTVTLFLNDTTKVSAQPFAPKSAPQATPFRDLFIELDTNNDRVIEPSEIPEAGRKAFDHLLMYGDTNHDEKLQAEEFRDLLLRVDWAHVVPPEQRENRFKILDRNHDGKLDRQEFQGGPARFRQLDRNGDGYLSRNEIPWLNPNAAPAAKKPKS